MTLAPASLWRRLGAMIYDAFIVFGLLFVAAIPLTAIDADTREKFLVELAIQAYLLAVLSLYFVVSWRRGGQTVGMRAWRLRLLDAQGATPPYRSLFIRLVGAPISALPAGAGYWWILFDGDRQAVHDKLSSTFIFHEKR